MDRMLDKLLKAMPAIIVVLGAVTVLSIAMAIADERPAPTAMSGATELDLPADHERMLGVMRAGASPQHLEQMAADPAWQELRDPAHTRHLEAYQQEVERAFGRTAPRP